MRKGRGLQARGAAVALVIALAVCVAAPSSAVAALADPVMGNTIVGNGFATVGWWAPGVPLVGWSSELQWTTTGPDFTSGVTTVVVPGGPIADYGEYTLSSMTNGTPCYLRVRSNDGGGGLSAWSAPISVTPYPPLPNSTWIFAGAPGTRLARTRWNAAARATRYQVQRANNTSFSSGATIVYDGPALSKVNTGLTSGRTYYYRVRSLDQWGRTSLWSNTVGIRPR